MLLLSLLISFFYSFESLYLIVVIVIGARAGLAFELYFRGVSPWVRFVLFIVFLGGILILYAYVISLCQRPRGLNWAGGVVSVGVVITLLTGGLPQNRIRDCREEAFGEILSYPRLWSYFFLFGYLLAVFVYLVIFIKRREGALRSSHY